MSKIRLHGSSSGYMEIAPPAAGSSATVTLPNSAGEILLSDGSAASLTQIPAANIVGVCTSGLTKTGGFGKILQVVQTVKTDASSFSSNNTNTFVDWTGLSLSITPTSSSSKVLVSFTVSIGPASGGTVHVNLVRDSTNLVVGDSGGGSRLSSTIYHRPASSPYSLNLAPLSYTYLDSPNTTSATTYKLQGTLGDSYNYTYYINRSASDADASYGGRVTSTITAMEVGA